MANASQSASRVSLDHFDPEGVRELSKTLTRTSTQVKETSVRSSKSLEFDEPFSLETTLRTALDKYAHFIFYWVIGYLTTSIGSMKPVSGKGSLVCTSRTSKSLVSAQQRLTKQPSDRYSTPKSSGRNSKVHGNRPQEKFFMTSTAW